MLPKKNAAIPARHFVVRAGTYSSKWRITTALRRRAPPCKHDTLLFCKADDADTTGILVKQLQSSLQSSLQDKASTRQSLQCLVPPTDAGYCAAGMQVMLCAPQKPKRLTNSKLLVLDLLIDGWCLHSQHRKQLVSKHYNADDTKLHHLNSLRHCCLQITGR